MIKNNTILITGANGLIATKAKTKLGWEPKVKFKELVKMMVDSDLR